MTLLSRKTDYALLILTFLHTSTEGGSASKIAERFGLSKAFVANILKELCQKGFVASHRGVKGGYALQRPAEEISVAELLQALEDGLRLTSCTGHSTTPETEENCTVRHVCPIRGPVAELNRRITQVLEKVSLADLSTANFSTGDFQQNLSTLTIRGSLAVHDGHNVHTMGHEPIHEKM